MNISLNVEGQSISVDEVLQLASDTIQQVDCSIQTDSEWSGFDLVKCVWENQRVSDKYVSTISDGTTTVPWEVLTEQGSVRVNLIGYDVTEEDDEEVITERLTTFKIQVISVKQKVNVSGSNSASPTAEEWEQQLAAHSGNTNIHTNATEKATWNAKLSDAPSDSKTYGRKNGAWTEVEVEDVDWEDVQNKPSTFPPSSHTHTKSEISDLPDTLITKVSAGTGITTSTSSGEAEISLSSEAQTSLGKADSAYQKPSGGIPKTDLASAVQTSLGLADSALQEHQSLSAYRTSSAQDVIDETKVDKVTGKGLSEEDFTSTLKTKLDGIEEGAEVNIAYATDPYAGADLTVKFADEISNFSDEWAWIKNRKTTGNFEGLHTHDYIPVTCENASAYVLKMEIAGINTYKGAGASEIGNHIDFISKDCWPDTVQYNPVNYNNGICLDKFTADGATTAFQLTHRTTSTFPSGLSAVKVNGTAVDASTYSYDSSTGVLTFTTAPASGAVIKAVWATADRIKMPFLASNLRAFLMSDKSGVPNEAAADPTLTEVDFTNGGIWKYLPTKVKNVIIDKMGYPGTRLVEGTLRTSENTWDSANQGKLWLPCEMEVYGEHIWSTTYESAFGRQYPCFMNGNRKKGAGNGGSRSSWWLSSPYSGSSSLFCLVYIVGYAYSTNASNSYRVPVCFRI